MYLFRPDLAERHAMIFRFLLSYSRIFYFLLFIGLLLSVELTASPSLSPAPGLELSKEAEPPTQTFAQLLLELRDERLPLEDRLNVVADMLEQVHEESKIGNSKTKTEVVCTLRDQWIGKANTELEARQLAFSDCYEQQPNVFQEDCIGIKHEIVCE